MQINASTPDEYIKQLPEDRKAPVQRLRQVMQDNLPPGFEETMSYGMIGYVVPHSKYAKGYHVDSKLPLPFINIASQKNFIALYHNGLYVDKTLEDWFVSEYPKHVDSKLDMGKSCIRFKRIDQIPYELIGELASKMRPEDWVELYEQNIQR